VIRGSGGDNGVRAPERGAGTPTSFPDPVPVTADPETLAALDLAAALDLVAAWASGPLGAARVRSRRPIATREAVQADLALAEEALGLLLAGDGLEVAPVPDLGAALDRLRIEGSVLDGPELLRVRDTLAAARAVARELRRVTPRAPRLAELLVPVPDRSLEARLDRSLDPDGGLLDSASPALAAARREVQAARDRLVRKLEAILRSLDPQTAARGGGVTLREGRYVIPVRRDARSRPGGIVHGESGSAGTLFIEPTEAIELGNALREAVSAESRETLRVLRDLTGLLRPEAGAIAAAHAMCVRADDAVARGRYARSVGAGVPAILPGGGGLTIRGGRHPLLLARGAEVVPFDLVLGPGERTLLVSGPNAGGKTVLLKAVGLLAALVQAGVIPPVAPGSAFPVFDRLDADIGDHQSLAADLSTFSAHLAFLRRVLREAGPGALVLLDELGSGTDPAEGAALGWATLEALARRGALTLATTHLGALKTLASGIPGVTHGSLEFDGAVLSPTYRFRAGVPGQSWGLAMAKRLGVDPDVVARAESHVPEAQRALDALLDEVTRRERALADQEAELARLTNDARRRTTGLERGLADLATRDQDLRRRERELEREAGRQVRAWLLEARKQVEAATALAREAETDAERRAARRMVEEAIAAAADAGAGEREPGPVPEAIRPGARVRLVRGGIGKVEHARPDGRLLVQVGSLRLVIPADGVAGLAPAEAPRVATPRAVAAGPAAKPEADLRGLRVDEAGAATLAAVDAAVQDDLPFLRIIHGKGTGAVREMVHRVLRGDPRVARYALAPTTEGGSGVTIVEFEGAS
jgi:DNA mismatch repair protein MutS2